MVMTLTSLEGYADEAFAMLAANARARDESFEASSHVVSTEHQTQGPSRPAAFQVLHVGEGGRTRCLGWPECGPQELAASEQMPNNDNHEEPWHMELCHRAGPLMGLWGAAGSPAEMIVNVRSLGYVEHSGRVGG